MFQGNSNILAIGAHPDDIEIGCGGTLARLVEAGSNVTLLVCTHGACFRATEAHRASKSLGVASCVVLTNVDSTLHLEPYRLIQSIEQVMHNVSPGVILTHTAHDNHLDHESVYRATVAAARHSTATILCYQSPSSVNFQPCFFVDLLPEAWETKESMLADHESQKDKPYVCGAFANRMACAWSLPNEPESLREAFEVYRSFWENQ